MPYKKITFFVIVLVLVLTINDLAHSIYATWQKQDLIVKAQKNLDQEQKENQKLKKAIAQVNQPQFVETEARNKLFLAKPGEKIVVIPTDKLHASPSASTPPLDTRRNWEKWWDVFFKA